MAGSFAESAGSFFASSNPIGAGAQILGDAISTPITSRTGDVDTGDSVFGAVSSGGGLKIPKEVGIGLMFVAVVAVIFLLRR